MRSGRAVVARELFQLAEQAAAEAETAHVRRDPHALQLRRCPAMELQDATADGVAVEPRHHDEAGRQHQLVGLRRDRPGELEPALEALVELCVVAGEAPLGCRVPWTRTSITDAVRRRSTVRI